MNTCTQTQTNNRAYTNMQSRHVNMSTHIYTPLIYEHIRTSMHMHLCTLNSANDGWQFDACVCVPKELALPLGPNQPPTAAGY